jgi:hypothetical protein
MIVAIIKTIARSDKPMAAPHPPEEAMVLPAFKALVRSVESVDETEVSGVPQFEPPTPVQTADATPSAPCVNVLTTIVEKSDQPKARL